MTLPIVSLSLFHHISSREPFTELARQVGAGGAKVTTGNLPGPLAAIAAAGLARGLGAPILLVTPGPSAAEAMLSDVVALLGERSVVMLPPLKQHPFDTAPLASGPRNERTDALLRLLSQEPPLVVTQPEALLERAPSPDWLRRNTLCLTVGDDYPRGLLLSNLAEAGYNRESLVDAQGQFAVRGGLLDIFAVGHERPVRIEFDGDRVATLRWFDPSTQRSEGNMPELIFFVGDDAQSDELAGVFDLLPPATIIFWHDPVEIENRVTQFLDRAATVYRHRAADETHHPWLLYRSLDEINAAAEPFREVIAGGLIRSRKPDVDFSARRPDPFAAGLDELGRYIGRYVKRGLDVWITAETQGERERIDEILTENALDTIATAVPTLSQGFVSTAARVAVLTTHELLGRRRLAVRRARFRRKPVVFDRSSLRSGDLVVHATYGIGRYEGMQTVKVRGQPIECLRLIYQDDVVLYVRASAFGLVEKFIGAEGAKPHLSRIGTGDWARTKKRTKKALADMAGELIKLYCLRKVAEGHSFPADTHWQQEMEASFDYVDTPDQATSAAEVKADLQSPNPMDRLLCGDVGFGKTEVAVRAAFKVVQESHQVALLVPTTILAQQHYETFRYRLAPYPVRVEALSRFHTTLDQRRIVSELKDGRIDVVIGTHRLLSKDVEFKRLGLVVIDEEHRFGVRHKERLKQLRTNVDVLTMTATPIPRTLHLALMGARDTSQINTPPVDRLPVATEIHGWSDQLIRDAILQETDRQGQVFFVHNRVESIYGIKGLLERLVPGVRCAIAHGQMPEGKLERVMLDFMNQRYDVLICTTIIESGIDIPNVNTLIVNRADKFGLAQLYQLRGRIGRSSRQAYAYLLTPPRIEMTDEARRRLATLSELTELGSGMKVALRDLEIRGAGNLLGAEQHGFVNAVGFDLYTKLLDEAVREIKGQEASALTPPEEDVQIDHDGPALLPGDYIDDGDLRYDFYRRLAAAMRIEDVDRLAEELTDRFGTPPVAARNLLDLLRLKIMSRKLRFLRLTVGDRYLAAALDLPDDTGESQKIIGRLVALADPEPVEFRMRKQVDLLYRYPLGDGLRSARRFLQRLTREGIFAV